MSDEDQSSEITEKINESTECSTEDSTSFNTETSEALASEFTEGTDADDECDSGWDGQDFLFPQDILKLDGRHIRAEDSNWALSPVPELAEIIIKAAEHVKGPELENLIVNATAKQRKEIIKKLPLDIPFEFTLPVADLDVYWERQCKERWPHCVIWRYNDEWKALFVERSVQESIENFAPGESDVLEIHECLNTFKNYVLRLEIHKLNRMRIESLNVDLADEDFEQLLDDYIKEPDSTSVFLDFDLVLGALTELKEFSLVLAPGSLDKETYQLSIKDFNSLFRGLKKFQKLEIFRCSNGFVTHSQLIMLTMLHIHHQHLRELNLSYNLIDDSLCDYIGKLVISPCPLEVLILKYNRITNDGAETIASALSSNRRLRKLDLSLNWIGDRGGAFLAKVLSIDSSLEELDVSRNNLTSESGRAFGDALRNSKSLRSLKIAGNNLGEDCGRQFHQSAVENRDLLDLDVKNCSFSPVDEAAVHKAIIHNRSLVAFSIYV